MKLSFLCLTFLALLARTMPAHSQFLGTLDVKGSVDNFYPVTFYDGGWSHGAATRLEIGRSNVHDNGDTSINIHGSLISTFTFHSTNWGNGANFIDADIRQRPNVNNQHMIGGWQDGATSNPGNRVIIWLRGNTFYNYRSNFEVSPVIYDGVANPLPFMETGSGPSHTFKTAPEPYVNLNGLSYQHSAYFSGTTNNYFKGNLGIGSPAIFTSINNAGLHINKGGHSSIILGDPSVAGHGGVVQTSDNMQRVFIGANMYDDQTSSWRKFENTKGSAGISIMGDASTGGAHGAQISFYASEVGSTTFTNRMVIHGNGNISIGTAAQTPYKLAVDGIISARKIKVTQEAWPDYVFAPSYSLMPLAQLESFINKHQHLPEIPSAAEVEKNGIDLGDNQARLLQKVEELTLYIIQQNKELEAVKTRLKALEGK